MLLTVSKVLTHNTLHSTPTHVTMQSLHYFLTLLLTDSQLYFKTTVAVL